MQQSGGVFFCCHNTFGRGKARKGVVDESDVFLGKAMVVAEGQGCQMVCQGRQVMNHLFWRGNACQQQCVGAFQLLYVLAGLCMWEDRLQASVVQRSEIQLLIGVEVHGLGDDTELHGLQVAGTLGDDDDVGAVLAAEWFAQASCRQQSVVDDQPMVVDQQDVDAGLHIAVLEGVVKQDDVQLLVLFCQLVDAVASLPVNGDGDVGELLFHLERLVTNLCFRHLAVGYDEAFAFAFVSPAEYGHPELVLQHADQILHMRSLARTAYGDVAYRDDRHLERTAL